MGALHRVVPVSSQQIWNYLKRWQEFVGWMPLVAVLAIAAWLFLGALDPLAVVDVMAQLVDIPIRAAQALCAIGLSYLVWRRWSYRMREDELQLYWSRLLAGDRGSIIIFVVNAGFYLCAFLALLFFFSR